MLKGTQFPVAMRLVSLLIFAALAVAPSTAQITAGSCSSTGSAYHNLSANAVSAGLFNNGGLFWGGGSGIYRVPKNDLSRPNSIFAAGVWMGALVNGEPRQAASDYGPWEFYPGPLNESGQADDADCSNAAYDRIYSVRRSEIDEYDRSGTLFTDADLGEWPTGLGAPTLTPAESDGIDNDNDGATDEAGEMARVDVMSLPLAERKNRVIDLQAGERPDLVGDEMAWWIMNDVAGPHNKTGSAPMGVEVHVTAYAYALAQPLNNTTFYRYRLFNRNPNPLTNAYLGFWNDADLGSATDDYVGYDTDGEFGYVYNGDNYDETTSGYGTSPPALGTTFVQGPLVDSPGETWVDPDGTAHPDQTRSGTAVFMNYSTGMSDWYNNLQGLWRDGTPMVDCGFGHAQTNTDRGLACASGQQPTRFMFSGDPVTGAFWSELNADGAGSVNTPSDRVSLQSVGPFEMAPGGEQTVEFALVWSRGNSNLDSVVRLRRDVASVREAYLNAFEGADEIPIPVDPPVVFSPADGATLLNGPVRFDALDTQTGNEVIFYVTPIVEEGAPRPLTRVYSAGDQATLDPGEYRALVTFFNSRSRSSGNPTFLSFTVSADTLRPFSPGGFSEFQVVANGAGPVAQPTGASADYRGFPGLGRANSQGQQSTDTQNEVFWFIATNDSYVSRAAPFDVLDFDDFVAATTQYSGGSGTSGPSGLGFVARHDYEIRFTAAGGKAWEYFGSNTVIDVPFELWHIGKDTPDDPSDDVRLIPHILDDDANGAFNLIADDSDMSNGDDDPFTDRI